MTPDLSIPICQQPMEVMALLAQMAKQRFDFFTKFVLHYLLTPFHKAMVEHQLNTQHSMILAPRGSGKSTIADVAYCLWRLVNDPNLRIAICSQSNDQAKSFLAEIKAHIDHNEDFRALFGDLQGPTWNEDRIIIATRTKIRKEPSIMTLSIGSGIPGFHFDIIIGDDLVSEENSSTEKQRDKTHKWFFNTLDPTLEPEGEMRIIGTRYHCLPPGELVATSTGLRPIETIKVGDQVLTHKGRWRKVTATHSKHTDQYMVGVRLKGDHYTTHLTDNHELWTENGWVRAGHLSEGQQLAVPLPLGETEPQEIPHVAREQSACARSLEGFTWKNAKRPTKEQLAKLLETHTYAEIAHLLGASKSTVARWVWSYDLQSDRADTLLPGAEADPEFWRTIGWWLADGSTGGPKNSVVTWTVRRTKPAATRIPAFYVKWLGRSGHVETIGEVTRISLGCAHLANYLREHFGKLAHGKRLPPWVFSLPVDCQKALVEGYFMGDGTFSANYGYQVSSASQSLIWGMHQLLTLHNVPCALYKFRKCEANDQTSAQRHTQYALRITPRAGKVYFNTLLDAQHVEVERCRPSAETFTDSQRLRRVADLESFWYSGPVHDLTVEEDSSYQGVSVTFHNSDDFYGFLAGQDHRKDASGQTISTYRHTLIGPNVFHVKALSPDPITGEEVSFWPEKFPLDYLLQKRRNAGAVNFALQYQNDPQLTAGGIIRVEDLEPYMWALPSDRPSNDQLTIFQGVDPAIGEKENNDFFAHCTIGVSADLHIYVLEIHLLKISFDKQVKFIIDQYHKYNTEKVAIETIAYQQALSQAVRQRDAWLDILEVKPRKDKTQRARIFSAYCERHEVHLHTLHYHLMETLVGMPNVDHDDSFDALDLAVEAAKQHVLMDTLVMRLDTNFRKR